MGLRFWLPMQGKGVQVILQVQNQATEAMATVEEDATLIQAREVATVKVASMVRDRTVALVALEVDLISLPSQWQISFSRKQANFPLFFTLLLHFTAWKFQAW